jgi:hypothetical protein
MSTIHQMRVEFDAPEDRLLLSIIGRDGMEIKMWLTRRFVRLLWPNLLKLAESTPEAVAQQTPEAKTSVVRFQHEQALAAARFSSRYDADKVTSQPLGEAPVLITQGKIKRLDDRKGANQIAFVSKDGKPVTMALDDVLLHSLSRLIRDAAKRAGWDLNLGSLTTETTAAQDGKPATRVLN